MPLDLKDDHDSAGGRGRWLYCFVRPLGHMYRKPLKSKYPLTQRFVLKNRLECKDVSVKKFTGASVIIVKNWRQSKRSIGSPLKIS